MNRNEPPERKTSREWKVTTFLFLGCFFFPLIIKNKDVTLGFSNFFFGLLGAFVPRLIHIAFVKVSGKDVIDNLYVNGGERSPSPHQKNTDGLIIAIVLFFFLLLLLELL